MSMVLLNCLIAIMADACTRVSTRPLPTCRADITMSLWWFALMSAWSLAVMHKCDALVLKMCMLCSDALLEYAECNEEVRVIGTGQELEWLKCSNSSGKFAAGE